MSNGYKGLQNLGNTCYMNSYLQCLFLTSQFRQNIISCSDLLEDNHNSNACQLLFEFNRLFVSLSSKNAYSYLTPIEMKYALPEPFNFSSQQQDSSEFGRIVIEILEEQLKKLTQKVNNYIILSFLYLNFLFI